MQKTAYEWRISDWSADVCSSDLPVRRRFGGARRGDALPGGGAAGLGRAAGRCRGRGRSGGGALDGGLHPPVDERVGGASPAGGRVRRARRPAPAAGPAGGPQPVVASTEERGVGEEGVRPF